MYHQSDAKKPRQIYYLPRHKGEPILPKKLMLSKAIDGFLLGCRARRLSEHTLTDYSRTLKRFLEHVGDSPIADITTTQVSAFLASQNFSEKTILNYHIGLAALWTWCIREGYAKFHIVRIVQRPKPQKIVVVPMSEAEIRAMLGAVKRNADRNKTIILLLLDTGMRASELLGLDRKDIDLANRRLKVLGKGNKERMLPFSARTASQLFRYLSDDETPNKPFPLTRTRLAHAIREIGARAGVDVNPHRFRHTFAVTYLRNGGDPYTLQEILGHSTMDMVKEYLALAQVDLDTAHKRASPVENWKL